MNKKTLQKLHFKKVTISVIDNVIMKGIKGGDPASRTSNSDSSIVCNGSIISNTDVTQDITCIGIDTIQTNSCP